MDEKYLKRQLKSEDPNNIDKDVLEAVPYIYSGRDTDVEIIYPEFTSVCPWTGLPDFGTITIRYIPAEVCIEFKALKFYLTSFRNIGILQEHAVNRILDDLVEIIKPKSIIVIGEFNARGGMKTIIRAEH